MESKSFFKSMIIITNKRKYDIIQLAKTNRFKKKMIMRIVIYALIESFILCLKFIVVVIKNIKKIL